MPLLFLMGAAIALVPLAAIAASPAPLPAPRYSVTGDPPIGSHLPVRLMTGPVPINRRWTELSPDEQALVKGDYEPLPPGDEPPFPAEGYVGILEAFIRACAQRCEYSTVNVAATIDSKGAAQSVRVLRADEPRVALILAAVVMQERYKPAVCQGVPCTMELPIRIKAVDQYVPEPK